MIDRSAASARNPRAVPPRTRAAAAGAALLVLGVVLAMPSAPFAQEGRRAPDTGAAAQGGAATGASQEGAADTVVGYARWAEEVLNQPPGGIRFLERLEQRIFELTNRRRREAGLDPLEQADDGLKRAARAHTVSQLRGDYFAHEAPGGRSVADRVAILARRFVGVPAENLFELTGPEPPFSQETVDRLAQTVVSGLMSSAGHRANILGKQFDELAVGAAVRGNRVVVTQVFGDRVATLNEALPLTVPAGTPLELDVSAAGGAAPTRYDYYSPERKRAVTLSLKLDSPLAMTEPGRYRLRFYVPRGDDTFEGYYGPDIVVRRAAEGGGRG